MLPPSDARSETRPARRVQKSLLAIVVGLAGALVVLEMVLQVGAIVVWIAVPTERAVSDRVTVMCVGDSNTHGVGASDESLSYPARLQGLLDADAPETYHVLRAALPGRNSRELLLHLPAQLERFQPDVVCVLVGTNDLWSQPERLTSAEIDRAGSEGDFKWRVRTLRLLRLVVAALGSDAGRPGLDPTEQAQRELSGVWHQPQLRQQLEITADGHMQLGGTDYLWKSSRFGQLRLVSTSGSDMVVSYTVDGSTLTVKGEQFGELAFVRGEMPEGVESMLARGGLHPEDRELLELMADGVTPTEAKRVAELMLGAVDRTEDASIRGGLLRGLGFLAGGLDQQLTYLARAATADGLYGTVEVWLKRHEDRIDRAVFDRCIADALLAEGKRGDERLQGAWANVFGVGFSTTQQVLRTHLHEIIDRCQAAGAKVLLMNYPLPTEEVEEVLAEFGEVPLVDLRSVFAKALQSHSYDELFIPDGHCNDKGYEIFAATVYEHLKPWLSR